MKSLRLLLEVLVSNLVLLLVIKIPYYRCGASDWLRNGDASLYQTDDGEENKQPPFETDVFRSSSASTRTNQIMFHPSDVMAKEYKLVADQVCPNPLPTLHAGEHLEDKWKKEFQERFNYQQQLYNENNAPKTFKSNRDIFSDMTVLKEGGNFVIWESHEPGELILSAYNKDKIIRSDSKMSTWQRNGLNFVSPNQEHDFRAITKKDTLKGTHAIFVIYFHSVFAHIFLDYLPYVAYLRDTLPKKTRFILVDTGDTLKNVLQELDPEFYSRVDWMNCNEQHHQGRYVPCENQLMNVRNGNLLVMNPTLHGRNHMEYYLHLRRWVVETHPPKVKSLEERTIVYYTRNSKSASHGRGMDITQEAELLRIIEEKIEQYQRPEKLVIFNGKITMNEQIDLFQSANFVIGGHGGGMANLIFLLPSETCEDRPKVLEFITSAFTPDVQDGGMNRSYYNMYQSCPWAEYHHILYDQPSNYFSTYIDLNDFRDALDTMFAPKHVLL